MVKLGEKRNPGPGAKPYDVEFKGDNLWIERSHKTVPAFHVGGAVA